MVNYRYDIYSSCNILIKYLGRRLVKRITDKLITINAKELFGLDIGCAYGDMLLDFYRNDVVREVVSIDIDKSRLYIAKQRINSPEYIIADTLNLCFKNDSFDFVVCAEVLEHLINPYHAMKEIIRVSGNNSFLIVSVPYEPYFHWGNIIRGRHLRRWGKTPSHVSFWNLREFRHFLHSFDQISVVEENSMLSFPWVVYLCKISKN